jgi:translation initiation factor IF-2
MPKKKLKKIKSPRPPVITVMGHIDHGKTTLLDALRQTNIAAKESGGITQHIGAYQIEHKGRKITFIDTPGHAAFAAMRSRGTQATDLVVLVIDAVEGVKAQTKECLDHIKAASAPFLVAINKIDLPAASPEKVKNQLAENNILLEGYGGDIVAVEISAKKKQGLDQLLEMILLLADMQQLTADPQGSLEGVVIESELDARRGPTATIIVKNGTLKVGDPIQAATVVGKVKALFNDQGKKVSQAIPGQPVLLLGFKQLPPVGANLTYRLNDQSTVPAATPPPPAFSKTNLGLKIILKADTAGTLEAITQNLSADITLISQAVGVVSESDVLLAQSTGARIVAFRVKPTSAAKKLAEIENISIKSYQLIYELLEDLAEEVLKLMEPTIDEEILGEAKIKAEFNIRDLHIAGCEVIKGKLSSGDLIHLKRGKKNIASARIKSLQQNKKPIKMAKKGEECGLTFKPDLNFKLKDTIIAYKKIS